MTWPLILLALAQAPGPIAFTSDLRPNPSRVGETIELRLTATWPKNVDRVSPRFDTWVGPFEIVQIDAGGLAMANARESQVWVIRLRTFEAGRVTIPGLRVDFQEIGAVDSGSAQTNDFVVESVAPSVDRAGSVRPMKGTIEPPRDVADAAVVTGVAALVVLLGVSCFLWLRSRHGRGIQTFNARAALRALQRARDRQPTDVDAFYTDVSTITRRFLEAAFNIPGTVLSSREIVSALRMIVRPGEPLERVSRMLADVDAVRFGGRIPTREEDQHVFDLTRALLLDRTFLVVASFEQADPAVPGSE